MSKLFRLAYTLGTYVLGAVLGPRLLKEKYRASLPARLGRVFPDLPERSGRKIWVHAVSVGETKAIAPLIRKLREEEPDAVILISNVTETGHQEAKRSIPEADGYTFLPFDYRGIVRKVLDRFTPDLVLLCETDIWYEFLSQCKERGAEIVLVNGKLSTRSQRRLARVPWIAKQLYQPIDRMLVQAEVYRRRFARIGVPRDKLQVTGNLKFDGEYPVLSDEEKVDFRKRLGLSDEDLVLVLGSTHAPEERQLLKALKGLWDTYPQLKILLVPRHPERFDALADYLRNEQHLPFSRYSILDRSPRRAKKIVLVDAMGVLLKCYQVSDVAIVCGSFTSKVGGHNILEPCQYGVPTLFGPHMHAQPDLCESALAARAAEQVELATVADAVKRLLADEQGASELGAAGSRFALSQQGATERSLALVGRGYRDLKVES